MPNRGLRNFDFDVERTTFCCGIVEVGAFSADTFEEPGYQGKQLTPTALKKEAEALTKANITLLKKQMSSATNGYSYAITSTIIQYKNKRKDPEQYWAGLMLNIAGWAKNGTIVNKKTGNLLQLWKYEP